jgi:hypothetical protein
MKERQMKYSQEITIKIYYDPELTEAPEDWNFPELLDLQDREDIEIMNVGPVTVEE